MACKSGFGSCACYGPRPPRRYLSNDPWLEARRNGGPEEGYFFAEWKITASTRTSPTINAATMEVVRGENVEFVGVPYSFSWGRTDAPFINFKGGRMAARHTFGFKHGIKPSPRERYVLEIELMIEPRIDLWFGFMPVFVGETLVASMEEDRTMRDGYVRFKTAPQQLSVYSHPLPGAEVLPQTASAFTDVTTGYAFRDPYWVQGLIENIRFEDPPFAWLGEPSDSPEIQFVARGRYRTDNAI